MKKKNKENNEDHNQEVEILKAVAQAWYAHSGICKSTNEYDAHRHTFQSKPSRFKIEAMNKSLVKEAAGANWDFKQSLWDSYEIVTVSKRLERGLVLDSPFPGSENDQSRGHRRRRESKNSLRSFFNRTSSRLLNKADIPREDDSQF